MSVRADLNLPQLSAALRRYGQATKKDMGEIVLRAAKTIAIGGKGVQGAVQLTPKATAAKIKEELAQDGLAFRLLASPRARKPRKLAGWSSKGKKAAEIRAAAKILVNARKSSAAATVAGWIKVVRDLGVPRGKRVSAKGGPGKSTATKPTARRLESVLINRARGADVVGREALAKAVANAAADMMAFAERKLAQTAAKA